MPISPNPISQPNLDIKSLWLPLIREELKKNPAMLKPTQNPQNQWTTRSMSQKQNINT